MSVPNLKMNNGHTIPGFGLGTWQARSGQAEEIIKLAIDMGYRHFDSAMVYGNEKEVGSAIREKIEEGSIKREDVFVVTKLWNTFHKPETVLSGCKESLQSLGLGYIDLYLIHWPFAFQEHEEFFPRDKDGQLLLADYDYVDTWKEMEKCVDLGLVKSIGLANFNSEQIERILKEARIKPTMNQIECHPYLNQKKLIKFCQERDILITSYSPLGSGSRPWARPDEPVLLEDPALKEISAKTGKTVAQVILRFLVQSNTIPIPKSTNPKRLQENFNVFDFVLNEEDMREIDKLNKNIRYCQFRDAKSHKDHPFQIEF